MKAFCSGLCLVALRVDGNNMQIEKYAALKKKMIFSKAAIQVRNTKPTYKAIHYSQMFHKRGMYTYNHTKMALYPCSSLQILKQFEHIVWISSALKCMQMKSVLSQHIHTQDHDTTIYLPAHLLPELGLRGLQSLTQLIQ